MLSRIQNPLEAVNRFFSLHPAVCVTLALALGAALTQTVDRLMVHETRHANGDARLRALEDIAAKAIPEHTAILEQIAILQGQFTASVAIQTELIRTIRDSDDRREQR